MKTSTSQKRSVFQTDERHEPKNAKHCGTSNTRTKTTDQDHSRIQKYGTNNSGTMAQKPASAPKNMIMALEALDTSPKLKISEKLSVE